MAQALSVSGILPTLAQRHLSWLLLACTLITPAAAQSPAWSITELSTTSLRDTRYTGLSGITHAQGDQYYCVSDRLRGAIPLTLCLSPDGRVTDGAFAALIKIKTAAQDFEGIAWMPGQQQLIISTELKPSVTSYFLSGKPGFKLSLPACYAKPRLNQSMEALTWQDSLQRGWTANESTLPCDAASVVIGKSAMVRLQEFAQSGKLLRQFAYQTEASTFTWNGVGSGVTDLCLLPDGTLLALERTIAGLSLKMRIYAINFIKATPTQSLSALNRSNCSPVSKTLLFEAATGWHNYEGIALGPRLGKHAFTLVTIADSGDASEHQIKILKLISARR